nr:PREDICTED: ral guanine nucleotide dissociation stimulator-like 1 [Anolis carolinensis]|eukprot:XP_008123549.1 PREDICTED: ral guanine nucleotide dissociation stimulator-like 1 [Anolis carolinensis]
MVKRLSLLFQGSDVISNTTPTKEQPSGSSGESMASDSVSPCESPDGPQKNLSESSSPSSSNHSMDTSSSGVSSFTLSPPLPLDSNPAIHPLSISNTSALWLPYYNQKSEESCIIRVHLEPSNGNMYKSILVCKRMGLVYIQIAISAMRHFWNVSNSVLDPMFCLPTLSGSIPGLMHISTI